MVGRGFLVMKALWRLSRDSPDTPWVAAGSLETLCKLSRVAKNTSILDYSTLQGAIQIELSIWYPPHGPQKINS